MKLKMIGQMKKNILFITGLFFMCNILIAEEQAGFKKAATDREREAFKLMQERPVQFLENKGQMMDQNGAPVPHVLFKASTPKMNMYITQKGITYVFLKFISGEEEKEKEKEEHLFEKEDENVSVNYCRVDMDLKGAVIKTENVFTEGKSELVSNYYTGNGAQMISDVHEYKKIIIKAIYPGIDWVLYGTTREGYKYDFIVHAGADPKQIKFVYQWAKVKNKNNNLQISTPLGILTDHQPVSYTESTHEPVASSFKLSRNNEVSFAISQYDSTQDLIIDPQLVWGTYYAMNDVNVYGMNGFIAVTLDASDNLFMCGESYYVNIPLVNPGSGAYFQGTISGARWGCYLAKFTSAGALVWSTYYDKGPQDVHPSDIMNDAAGNIFVVGNGNVPTVNPGGGAYFDGTAYGAFGTGFIAKFNTNGVLLWATPFSGTHPSKVAVDISGNVFMVGWATDATLPVKNPGAGAYFQVTKAAAVTSNAFIAKFTNAGVLLWCTYYGGSITSPAATTPYADEAESVTTDASGNVFVVGQTTSTNFPLNAGSGSAYFDNTLSGGDDAFILKFNNSGVLLWATYYGGPGTGSNGFYDITLWDIVVDATGNIFTCGSAGTGAPLVNPGGGAYSQAYGGGFSDLLILKFSNAGVYLWGTYYGGSGEDVGWYGLAMIIDPCNNDLYVTSRTESSNFPVLKGSACGYFNSYKGTPYASSRSPYILRFNNSGVSLWATYFNIGPGGFTKDITYFGLAMDASSTLYFTMDGEGCRTSPAGITMPVVNRAGAYNYTSVDGNDDGYLAKFIPVPMDETQSQVNPASCSCNGTATVNVTCGTLPLNYLWSNGTKTIASASTTNTITGLCPGNYWVEVKDASCIQFRDTVYYTIPATGGSLTLTVTQTNAACSGLASATVFPTGGNPSYTFLWSPSAQTTATATNLTAGTYTVKVTDSNGCSNTTTVTINLPSSLSGQFLKGSASCSGCGCKEWIMVTGTGGTAPYSYTWPDGYDKRYKNKLCPGTYTIAVKDNNGCSVNVSLAIP
jgi:hypothetical protein